MRTTRLDPQKAALVIVDMQGRLAELMHESEAVLQAVARMIHGADLFALPVLCVEQLPDKLGATSPVVAEALGDRRRIPKQAFSAWQEPAFTQALKESGRSQILLAGIESHVCVYQTGLDLLEAGYSVFLLNDCISSRQAANRQLGLARLEQAGAESSSMEMALFELQGEASGDRFREIIQLVR